MVRREGSVNVRRSATARHLIGGYLRRVDIGAPELIIILLVVLVIFGGSKLPQLARSLGQAKSEFEKGTKGDPKPSAEPASAEPAGDDRSDDKS
jgi:sec-independent protein translocase protein TatA